MQRAESSAWPKRVARSDSASHPSPNGKFDFNARNGVLRRALYGNDEADDGRTHLIEDRFTMGVIATESHVATSDAAHDHLSRATGAGFTWNTSVDNLSVEFVPANPFLSANRKWAIRFHADGIITIVLGMRDYGRGWFSSYFAGVLAARLGIPFLRVRIYYSATLPAVLQTPQPTRILLHESGLGPVAIAATDLIKEMCDRVIEKGRLTFAALAGVGAADIGFDQPTGRFYVLDRDRSSSILEIAKTVQGGSSASTELAKKLQRGGKIADRPAPNGHPEKQARGESR